MKRLPSPGQANTLSVTTAPETSSAASTMTTASTGPSALRSACRRITRRAGMPRARAASDERLRERLDHRSAQVARPARRLHDGQHRRRQHAGAAGDRRSRRRRASSGPTRAASRAPMANTICSSRPNQNAGSEMPAIASAVVARSNQPPRRTAGDDARRQRQRERRGNRRRRRSSSVAGSRSTMRAATGRPSLKL